MLRAAAGYVAPSASAPTIRASTTASGSTANTVINKPTGVVSGDLLIICASVANNTASIFTSTGFTSAANTTTPVSAVLYKVAGGSEPSTYTVATGTAIDTTITMFAITTGTYTTGIVDIGTWSSSGTGTTITAPALTVTNTNSLLIAHYGVRAATSGNTSATTTPTGMSATLGSPSANSISLLLSFNAVFSEALTASGSTGTRATTFTRTGTTSGHHGILFTIK